MNDRELQEAYAALFRARPASRTACPSPERLRSLVERAGSESERLETLDHAMSCSDCRSEFDLMQAVANARPREPRRFPLPLAAAAILALAVSGGLLWRSFRSGAPAEDPVRGALTPVELVAPRGDSAGVPLRFVWRATPDSAAYGFELFTPAGDRVYATQGADTVVTLPDSVSLIPGQTYHWLVVVRWPDGRERTTPPARFTPR